MNNRNYKRRDHATMFKGGGNSASSREAQIMFFPLSLSQNVCCIPPGSFRTTLHCRVWFDDNLMLLTLKAEWTECTGFSIACCSSRDSFRVAYFTLPLPFTCVRFHQLVWSSFSPPEPSPTLFHVAHDNSCWKQKSPLSIERPGREYEFLCGNVSRKQNAQINLTRIVCHQEIHAHGQWLEPSSSKLFITTMKYVRCSESYLCHIHVIFISLASMEWTQTTIKLLTTRHGSTYFNHAMMLLLLWLELHSIQPEGSSPMFVPLCAPHAGYMALLSLKHGTPIKLFKAVIIRTRTRIFVAVTRIWVNIEVLAIKRK